MNEVSYDGERVVVQYSDDERTLLLFIKKLRKQVGDQYDIIIRRYGYIGHFIPENDEWIYRPEADGEGSYLNFRIPEELIEEIIRVCAENDLIEVNDDIKFMNDRKTHD